MTETSPWIIDTTDETFVADVVERSRQLPVVVDFWAAWCGPCRMLGPVLEKLAIESAGKFLLAKVDVDRSQGVAAQFGVSSIPAVFAVRDGQLLDQFVGVLPEADLRRWLDGLQPTPAEQLLAEAARLAGDPAAAEAKLRQALTLTPDDRGAKIALAQALLDQDRIDESEELIGELAEQGFLEPDAERLKSRVAIRLAARLAGDVEAARAAAGRAPHEPLAQLNLAYALAGAGRFDEALPAALRVFQTDRRGQGEAARQLMVDIFHALPSDDELSTEYRRKLSAAMY